MNLSSWVIYLLVFLGIDMIYLTSVSSHFNNVIMTIQGSKISLDYFSAFLTYLSMAFGLYYFVLREHKSIFDAMIFGLIVYSVFEFTNKSILKKWDWTTVFMDTIWGGILFSLVTYIVYKLELNLI